MLGFKNHDFSQNGTIRHHTSFWKDEAQDVFGARFVLTFPKSAFSIFNDKTMPTHDLGRWIVRPRSFNFEVFNNFALVFCEVCEGKAEYGGFAGK